jgi:S1-C subfamily serine protease
VKRATLGVIITQVASDDTAGRGKAAGAQHAMRIDQVIAGSAADRAGIRVGDLLLSIAGQATRDIPTLSAAIAARSGPTELQVLRGDEVLSVTVDLQSK